LAILISSLSLAMCMKKRKTERNSGLISHQEFTLCFYTSVCVCIFMVLFSVVRLSAEMKPF
jgi:Na+/H+-dicarboxylate symporter